MPRLDPAEHKLRKERSALRCLDDNGKPLNDASKSVAVQDKRDQCDINRIVKKAIRPDGQIDATLIASLAKKPGLYGDFTNAVDFQTLQNRVIRVRDAFATLPAEVRSKFNNNPAEMVDFVNDPKNKAEAIKMGILPLPKRETKKIETPEGHFWIMTEDGVEIRRTKVEDKPKPAAATPSA